MLDVSFQISGCWAGDTSVGVILIDSRGLCLIISDAFLVVLCRWSEPLAFGVVDLAFSITFAKLLYCAYFRFWRFCNDSTWLLNDLLTVGAAEPANDHVDKNEEQDWNGKEKDESQVPLPGVLAKEGHFPCWIL